MKTEAFKQGARAFNDGKKRDYKLIPYTGGTNGWHDWLNGYDTARAQACKPKRQNANAPGDR